MIAVYETKKTSMQVVAFLESENWLQQNGYDTQEYAFIDISEEDHLTYTALKQEGKTIIVDEGLIKDLVLTEEIVKYIESGDFAQIENYDYRKEGVLYKKSSESDPEYQKWLFLQRKPEKVTEYLSLITNQTSVCVIKEGINCFFGAKSGLALLQSTFAQNENNDDFILDFDPSLISDNTMKTVKHIAFPNDDGEWRSIYKTLVEQSSINTEVEYQWIKSFNKALETCTSEEDLLKAFNDSKPSIFTRIKAIDDGLVSSAVHV
ncbi:MAG: hypothetical protein EBX50_01340 [Chitinophagia bacterium]|nr:hypothetical protein [Chitinophagia bacterium]